MIYINKYVYDLLIVIIPIHLIRKFILIIIYKYKKVLMVYLLLVDYNKRFKLSLGYI